MRKIAVAALFLLMMATVVFAAIVPSTSSEFSVSPDFQYVNWANSTGMGGFTANLTLTNNNATRNITLNVSMVSSIVNSLGAAANFVVVPNNQTNLTSSTSANITLIFTTDALLSGRYTGNITILNSTNSSENTSVSITLDIPLNVNASGYGTISGNVGSSGYELFYVNMSRVSAYGINVTVNSTDVSPLNLTIKDGSGTLIGTFGFNTTGNSTQLNYTTVQTGYWSLNFTSNTTTPFNATVQLLKGSLLVNNATSATVTNRTNLGLNGNVTLLFWLNNNADYDVSISSVSNSSILNHTLYPTKNMSISSINFASSTLSKNSGMLVGINVTVNTNISDTAGNYVGWIAFASDRGYPNTTLNVTLVVNLTGALDVGSVSFTNLIDGTYFAPGSNVSVTLFPNYQNGTAISVPSSYSVWIMHQNISGTTQVTNTSIRNLTLTNNNVACNTTACVLNVTIPTNGTLGGNYTLYAFVSDSNGLNYGTGTAASMIGINATALKLGAYYNGSNTELPTVTITRSNAQQIIFYANVTNYGLANAPAVQINMGALSDTSCADSFSPTPPTSSLVSVPAGTSNGTLTSQAPWIFTAANVNKTYCWVLLTATAAGGVWDRNPQVNISIYVDNTVSTPGTPSNQGNTPGAANTTNTTTTTSSQNDLTLQTWPREIRIEQGKGNTTSVRVKNTGLADQQNVKVSIDNLNSSWWSASASHLLLSGTSDEWTITFAIPNGTAIKNYSIAYVASNPNISARASGIIVILPGAATRGEISTNLTNMSSRLALLLEKMKGVANATSVNNTLQEAIRLIRLANSSIAAGDWLGAYGSLKLAEAKLTDAEKTFSSTGGAFSLPGIGNEVMAATIFAAVAAIGVLLYFLKSNGKLKWLHFPGEPWRQPHVLRHERLSGNWQVQRAQIQVRRAAQPLSHRLSPQHIVGQFGSLLEKLGTVLERADKRKDYHWKPKRK